MDYWEKADYSWSDDSKRHILTPSSKSRTLFYYIQELDSLKPRALIIRSGHIYHHT